MRENSVCSHHVYRRHTEDSLLEELTGENIEKQRDAGSIYRQINQRMKKQKMEMKTDYDVSVGLTVDRG